MKKLLALLLLSPLVVSEESITLECVGNANIRGVSTISSNTSVNPGMAPIKSNTYVPFDKNKSASIIISLEMELEQGTLEVPSNMRQKFAKEYKTNFTELSISDSQIKGKFRWNNIDRGKLSINRNTGTIDYKNRNVTFTGDCSAIDISKKKF